MSSKKVFERIFINSKTQRYNSSYYYYYYCVPWYTLIHVCNISSIILQNLETYDKNNCALFVHSNCFYLYEKMKYQNGFHRERYSTGNYIYGFTCIIICPNEMLMFKTKTTNNRLWSSRFDRNISFTTSLLTRRELYHFASVVVCPSPLFF